MKSWWSVFERLCRLMCGRSPTFRQGFNTDRGCAPKWGAAPRKNSARGRWGVAATAHQAAQPRRALVWRLIGSRICWLLVIAAAVALNLVTVFDLRASEPVPGSTTAMPEAESIKEQMQFPQGLDYGKFQHGNANHSRLPCLLCHRRDTNSSVPKLPGGSGHLPCAGCHAQQFAGGEGPICTICHTDAKSGAVKSFPRLKSFRMTFDHSQHLRMGNVGCTTCHRPARGGVALSIPSGFNAHTTCFRCHTPNAQSAGRNISSCGTCHQLGGYARTPESAAAFRVGFTHAKHQTVTCNGCHQIRAGLPQRRQVTAPEPLNHHATGRGQSCMTCHNGKRAFGGDDFSTCTRCHTGKAWRF